ncbi:MAG TPA: radical SAM protein [Bacteroidales bacterium]|nr:radical SAM protein [Bacteroidales bacterium]
MFYDNKYFINCNICPRQCNANRYNRRGTCSASDEIEISSIVIHKGEEPIISGKYGILNVFFSNCNLRCIYCQNYQISINNQYSKKYTVDQLVDEIKHLLPPEVYHIGLVTPTHYAIYLPEITEKLRSWRPELKFVYNSSGYDKAAMIRLLKNCIDVYLPDFKYALPEIAQKYSHAKNYPQHALNAIKEMIYQKGTNVITDENELAVSGVIVRHLVLPDNIENSLKVLDLLYDNFGTNIWISLMSQYTPIKYLDLPPELQHSLTEKEYTKVINYSEELGFYRGWIQDLEAVDQFIPDFSNTNNPFVTN